MLLFVSKCVNIASLTCGLHCDEALKSITANLSRQSLPITPFSSGVK